MGKNQRHLAHLKEAKNHPNPVQGEHKLNTIRKLLKQNLEPIIKIVDKHLSKDIAAELEQFLISQIGRSCLNEGPLTNLAKGGEGGCAPGPANPNYGNRWTDEQKLKMSLNNKGNKSRTGMKNSDEAKAKQSFRAQSRPKISCPYCSKIGSSSQMKRWHFDNCKFKQSDQHNHNVL